MTLRRCTALAVAVLASLSFATPPSWSAGDKKPATGAQPKTYVLWPDGAPLAMGKGPADVWVYDTTGNYFYALHLQPYLGRFFHALAGVFILLDRSLGVFYGMVIRAGRVLNGAG